MSSLTLPRDIPLRSNTVSALRQTTRLETIGMACTIGMAGAGLAILSVILSAILAQMTGFTPNSALTDPAGGPSLGLQLASLIWGGAFLAMHMACLRRIRDSFWQSAFGITVFACLALGVSLLFTTLLLTVSGPGVLAAMLALQMVTGFSVTAIGLIIRAIQQTAPIKHLVNGSRLTRM